MKNKKGFTLAELLVVVAIIAVLVAISIPLFSSQIEKAREATDLANIRAAYAELMSAVITGDTEVDKNATDINGSYPLKSNPNIYYFVHNNNPGQDGNVEIDNYFMLVDICQKEPGWQTTNAINSLNELFTPYVGGNPNEDGDENSFDTVDEGKVAMIAYIISKNSTTCSIFFQDKSAFDGD